MRTIWNIGIILSLLFLPWWITVILIIVACLYINKFYESMFYGILLDSLYGTKIGIYGFAYVFTVLFIMIFFFIQIIRRQVMW